MTEEVIIDLKLEQNESDFAKLANLRNSISNLKDQQKQLNEDFKQGKVPIQQYNAESVKLETNLKKTQAAYSGVQRGITGLKNPFDKLNESIKEQAKQVNVAGISLATFANPVTATAGLLGGLFTAYSKTTIGAKDLEFASNQLSAAFMLLGNSMASTISGQEDGQGFFSKALDRFLNYYAPAVGAVSKHLALMKEELEDLQRDEIRVRADNNERLEENAQLLTKLADSTVSLDEKRKAATQAVTNLRINESELLSVKEKQLKILQDQLNVDKANEDLDKAVKEKEKEISRIKSDTERKVSAIDKLESNILDSANKQATASKERNIALENSIRLLEEQWDTEQKIAEEKAKRDAELGVVQGVDRVTQKIEEDQQIFDSAIKLAMDLGNEEAKIEKENADNSYNILKEKEEKGTKKVKEEQEKRLTALSLMASLAKGLFDEQSAFYKALSIAQASIDAYRAFNLALATYPPPFGAIAGAASLALGLANVSKIAGFADGGVVSGTKIKDGKRIQRSNGDDVLITAKRGEVILNERQQRALGGDKTFAKLGVPGFAMGGMVTSPSTSFGADSDLIKRMLRDISRRQVAVVIEDVERLQQTRAQIVEQATL